MISSSSSQTTTPSFSASSFGRHRLNNNHHRGRFSRRRGRMTTTACVRPLHRAHKVQSRHFFGGRGMRVGSSSSSSSSSSLLCTMSLPDAMSASGQYLGDVSAVTTDAWSAFSNGLPPEMAGIETKLFQASLIPYLVYLWFLSRDETETPEASKFGANFLLLFVFATIPAGIAAKTQFGDILANVDILHGSSEALLTLSNLFFFMGFAYALSGGSSPTGASATKNDAIPWKSVAKFIGIVSASSVLLSFAIPLGFGDVLHEEPTNALSLLTWGVHVSSITEWTAAMGAVWAYAEFSGNKKWKNLTWAMSPFLASGLSACTFHFFYNPPELGALVPLQALLTLTGNCTCAFAAYTIWDEAKSHPSSSTKIGENMPEFDADAFILKLALWTVSGASLIKYGELFIGDAPLEPDLVQAMAIIIFSTTILTMYSVSSSPSEETKQYSEGVSEAPADPSNKIQGMKDRIKTLGVSGTISYVLIELMFWAIAFPVALSWYRYMDGNWLDLSDPVDKAKLLGAGTVFINIVRLLVPFRLGTAIMLAPKVEEWLGMTKIEGERSTSTNSEKNNDMWSSGNFAKALIKNGDKRNEIMKEQPSNLPSLTNVLNDCPRTRWNCESIDINSAQQEYKNSNIPECPLALDISSKLDASSTNEIADCELAWLRENADDIRDKLLKHGCIHLKGLELTKTYVGFRKMYEVLGFNVCMDPIHTSGLRKFASETNGIYEEVNKPALRKHYIGLHNESTTNRCAAFGAFVCFKPAEISGGEFFIADGKRIFRDIDSNVLDRIYRERVRISVSNLDFFAPIVEDRGNPKLEKTLKEGIANVVDKYVAPMFDMELDMVWGADGMINGNRLQAIEKSESPINRHPVTNEVVWFCNIHNHSRYLRDNRMCTVPEVGMTEVYNGNLKRINEDDLDEIDRASRKNIVPVAMKEGEVLLVDNYRVLHGRDTFEGDRYHAVSWFTFAEEANAKSSSANTTTGNTLNSVINKMLDLLPK